MNRIDGESETFVAQAIGFYANDSGNDAGDNIAPTLRAMPGGGGNHPAVAFAQNTRDELRLQGGDGQISGALGSQEGMKQRTYLASHMAVRRLTPRECERLQGFHDGHTVVPHRGKEAADGPRYKSLGNSMAVPVLRWILSRIEATA